MGNEVLAVKIRNSVVHIREGQLENNQVRIGIVVTVISTINCRTFLRQ